LYLSGGGMLGMYHLGISLMAGQAIMRLLPAKGDRRKIREFRKMLYTMKEIWML
jgi:hypothetical protein